ncbi:MAG: hypothetical protein IPP32_12630 [Bacteroidetes bacterium]|nr:hypothetical protein [Bacteroidota bacterium]
MKLAKDETFENYLIGTLKEDFKILKTLKEKLQDLKAKETKIAEHEGLKEYDGLSKVQNIKVQFENGFIESIQVTIENNTDPLMLFENSYPIGFSSNFNYDSFDKTVLFIRNDEHSVDEYKFIYLSEVLMTYENLLENNRRDYSCADTTINKLIPNKTPIVTLIKDKSVNLFDTRIYTDFFGLSDKNPNGLVQTEIRRRFNLFTNRYQLTQLVNIGYVNYLIPTVCITKLEDKERFLILKNDKNFVNNQLVSPSYATTIDYLKYEALNIGMETNIVTLGVPNGKVSFYFDMGVRYSRVPVQDSTRKVVNSEYRAEYISNMPAAGLVTWYPKLSADIKSDNRLGFDVNFMLNNSTLLSNNLYNAVASYSKSNTTAFFREPNSRYTETFEFNARYLPDQTNPGNKVFARFRLTWQVGDMNTFYPQFQFGYSYKLKYTAK